MKTTIDIPEPLYKQVKIRAIETGRSLRLLVLESLSRELEVPAPTSEREKKIWDRRHLLPEYKKAMKAGAYRPAPGARDITDLIAEDRDGR